MTAKSASDFKNWVFIAKIATLACTLHSSALLADEQLVAPENVTLSVIRHYTSEAGLIVDAVLSNETGEDVCVIDPPSVSLVATIFDERSGYLVQGEQNDDPLGATYPGGTEGQEKKRTKLNLPTAQNLRIQTFTPSLRNPYLVDKSYVKMPGTVNSESLSFFVDIALVDCSFANPDDAMRAGRYQLVKSQVSKLDDDGKLLILE